MAIRAIFRHIDSSKSRRVMLKLSVSSDLKFRRTAGTTYPVDEVPVEEAREILADLCL